MHRIARRAGVVASFTMGSRILGAIRDMVVFHAFGATAATDAFFVAFTIPNVFRRLVGEGALAAAFVPVYLETRQREGPQGARSLADATFTATLLAVGAITALGALFAGGLVLLFAAGFAKDPAQLALATLLTRAMFPYLLLISGVALCMGLLNANGHFAAPAAAPMLLNLAIIGLAYFSEWFSPPVLSLAVGVLVGGVAQLALQLPALLRLGITPRPTLRLDLPGTRKLLRLLGPAVFGLAVYQINIIVLRQLASFLPAGHISYLYNADRLMELTLGVFAISIATAALPSLSQQAAAADRGALVGTFAESLRLTNFITVPAAVGLVALATPIVSVLYLHGRFTPPDAEVTARALIAFAPGLVAIAIVRLVAQTFYALSDTRTPALIAGAALVVNAGLGVALLGRFDSAGLAAALSIATGAQALLLLGALRRKLGAIGLRPLALATLRHLTAAGAMGAAVAALARLGDWQQGPALPRNVLLLVAAVVGGVALYGLLVVALKGDELRLLREAWRERGRSKMAMP
ncbi:MAG: murein biosynthesis integral membrane protein MurJ [Deltaproteobacteria bacterium]|nr:murein biosynthesis integral membrane protein MurJ [Deltaproteobacteria bacterium]